MNEPIMTFQIFVEDSQISSMEGPYGAVTMIPFTGRVESELFTGEILPGAVDVQVENPAGSRNMCAKYMFQGKDREGNACHLFVENNGYFSKARQAGGVLPCLSRIYDGQSRAGRLSVSGEISLRGLAHRQRD